MAGGDHIIEDGDVAIGPVSVQVKGVTYIPLAFGMLQMALLQGRAYALHQPGVDGDAQSGSHRAGQLQCLVIATLAQASPVERDRHDGLGPVFQHLGQMPRQQQAEDAGDIQPLVEFHLFDQAGNRWLVEKGGCAAVVMGWMPLAVAAGVQSIRCHRHGPAAAGAGVLYPGQVAVAARAHHLVWLQWAFTEEAGAANYCPVVTYVHIALVDDSLCPYNWAVYPIEVRESMSTPSNPGPRMVPARSSRFAAKIFNYGNIIAMIIPLPLGILWAGASMLVYAMNRHHPNERVGHYTQQAAYRLYGVLGFVVVVATFFGTDPMLWAITWAISAAILIPWSIIDLRRIGRETWTDTVIPE